MEAAAIGCAKAHPVTAVCLGAATLGAAVIAAETNNVYLPPTKIRKGEEQPDTAPDGENGVVTN